MRSATTTMCRLGSQRRSWSIICRAQSVILLVWQTDLTVVLFRRYQSCQDRQSPGPVCPGPVCPGDGRKPHQAYPAQSGRLDQMGLAGAHSVSVHAQSADVTAAAALDRLVYTEHHRLIISSERSHQKHQQDSAELERREDCTVEDMVVLGESCVVAESHDTKRRRDGALVRTEDGSEEQHLSFQPCPLLEQS